MHSISFPPLTERFSDGKNEIKPQQQQSPWNQYFKNEDLKKEIFRDLERTYPEHDFFQTAETQNSLCRALFVYARDHPECGYRQGMHELLAPMYYVVHTESTAFGAMVAEHTGDALAARAAVQEMRVILDPRFIEHDSYALFAALMNTAEEFFLQSKVPIAPTLTPAQAAAERAAQEQLTPVVARCRKIHHVLLRQKDPVLYAHLQQCHIEPQLYAMRWLRLLFGREFHLQDLLVLWDAIFAYGRSLALADYIAVAMLIYIREQLLQMDEVTAMKRLLKYPPVEDITLFITKAMELCTPGKVQSAEQLAGTPAAESQTSASAGGVQTPLSHSQKQPQQQQPQQQQHRNVFDMLAQAMASTAIKVQSKGSAPSQQQAPQQQSGMHRITLAEAEANAAELNKLRPRIAALEDERRHSCARLERVIYSLQQELTSSFAHVFSFFSCFVLTSLYICFCNRPSLAENGTIINALAELKQLHAVFSGIVDPAAEPTLAPQ